MTNGVLEGTVQTCLACGRRVTLDDALRPGSGIVTVTLAEGEEPTYAYYPDRDAVPAGIWIQDGKLMWCPFCGANMLIEHWDDPGNLCHGPSIVLPPLCKGGSADAQEGD